MRYRLENTTVDISLSTNTIAYNAQYKMSELSSKSARNTLRLDVLLYHEMINLVLLAHFLSKLL